MKLDVAVIFIIPLLFPNTAKSEVSYAKRNFILYNVNTQEGFNLQRDVYIRMANLIRILRDPSRYPLALKKDEMLIGGNWILVLPVWGLMPHWQNGRRNFESSALPWSTFFNVDALNTFIPVMEFKEFRKQAMAGPSEEHKSVEDLAVVDVAFQIQQYDSAEAVDGAHLEIPSALPQAQEGTGAPRLSCRQGEPVWTEVVNGETISLHWSGGIQIRARSFYCVHGVLHALELATVISKFLLDHSGVGGVLIDAADNLINGIWSEWSQEYWTARRSMVFSDRLTSVADAFRSRHLTLPALALEEPSNDSNSSRSAAERRRLWEHRLSDAAEVGPYVAVHWRRGDFPEITTTALAAMQIKQAITDASTGDPGKSSTSCSSSSFPLLSDLSIFLATDANDVEIRHLRKNLEPLKVVSFKQDLRESPNMLPGEIAIVDQWICAQARLFIGTNPSTFSFRITEERQILGLCESSTYNSFCPHRQHYYRYRHGDDEDSGECEGFTPWRVIYEASFTKVWGNLNNDSASSHSREDL